MQLPPLRKRVERLENQVDHLVDLPARMDAFETRLGACEVQILQLRGEMRAEFVAVREQIARVNDRQVSLEAKIAEGDAETRAFMRILHEDLVRRIAVIGDKRL